ITEEKYVIKNIMASVKIVVERLAGFKHIVRIPSANISDSQTIFEALRETFDSCLNNGNAKIIVDLKNVRFPSSSLIALLIEATSRARKLDGDVKIINLSHTAKNNLATFSALSYLSVEKDEAYALQDFQDSEPVGVKAVMPSNDIVEDPLIEKFEDSFEELATAKNENSIQEVEETEKNAANGYHKRVKSTIKNLYTICDFVTQYAKTAGFNAKHVGKTKIAVYEACLNIVEHAYHSNPDNWIDVWVDYDDKLFTVIIQDYGEAFEGLNIKDYDVLSAMDHRQTGGFGLYIIRRSMDEIEYQSDKIRGNRLKLVKYIN
ncbi:MAG: ATP-binding protein, partial [bacterium]